MSREQQAFCPMWTCSRAIHSMLGQLLPRLASEMLILCPSDNGRPGQALFIEVPAISLAVCKALTGCTALQNPRFRQTLTTIANRQLESQALYLVYIKQEHISIKLCDVSSTFDSLPFLTFSSPEAALLLFSTQRSAASGDENAFPVMKQINLHILKFSLKQCKQNSVRSSGE